MAKSSTGIGRQRFNFTGTGTGANASSPTGSGDEPVLVELIDTQFNQIISSFQKQQPHSPVGFRNPSSGPVIPFRDAATLVELVDHQFDGVVNGLKNIKPNQNKNTPSTNNVQGPRGNTALDYMLSIVNRFRGNKTRSGRIATSKLKKYGRRLQRTGKRLSSSGVKMSKSAGGGVGGVLQSAGGLLKNFAGVALQGVGMLATRFAGPIGVAVSGVTKFLETMEDGIRATTAAVSYMGDAAVKVAGNDGFGVLIQSADAAAGAMSKIPVVGGILAAGFDLAGTSVKAFSGALSAFTNRGRELAMYNGQIAGAVANAQVVKLMADIREANINSARYSQLILDQARLEVKFQEALQPLKEMFMDLLSNNMTAIEGGIQIASNLLQQLFTYVKILAKGVAKFAHLDVLVDMAEAMAAINHAVDQIAKKDLDTQTPYHQIQLLGKLGVQGANRISDPVKSGEGTRERKFAPMVI